MEIIKFQKAKLEKNQLIIDEDTSLDEWKDLGQLLKQVEGSVQFWIGDWARFGEKKGFTGKYVSPKVYDELEEITGYDRSSIQKFKSIADATSGTRVQDLSFNHHRQVAPLEPTEQEYFLNKASEEKLSVRELRDEIKATKPTIQETLDTTQFLAQKKATEDEIISIAKDLKTKYNKQQLNFLITLISK